VLQNIHTHALRRAQEILGGNERLRDYLGVSEGDLLAWTQSRELPQSVFLRLVDIITQEEVRTVSRVARAKRT
jgi:DNA-binding transcriptional regulator YiaG